MICKCGHAKRWHKLRLPSLGQNGIRCGKCLNEESSNFWWHPFKPDNLKYLEQKYEESIR
jgi:hypothetical protein